MLRLLDTYSYMSEWVMKAVGWVATPVITSCINPLVDPLVDAIPYASDYATASSGGGTETEVSTLLQHREAAILPAREDHSFGADTRAEGTHGPPRQDDMEIMAPCTDSTSPNTLNSDIPGNSFFTGAHHFIINNPLIGADPTSEMERKMMKLLQKKALVDATYDSAARHDSAPQCHPDTRISLRERIITWLLNVNRGKPLFWLYGPAGVGKSAIAQSLMEYCTEHGFPGAGIFLSRANKRNDPNRVIPSLAHQLALTHPAYRRAITNLLIADSTTLEKRLPLQFRQLIEIPADTLNPAGDLNVPSHPILLLIDGLDECNTESAQRELIGLVADFASTCKVRCLPFVCVITSRPEGQIVSSFNRLGSNLSVWREELPMNTPEARRDVETVLRAGFDRIIDKHDDALAGDTEWPVQAKFREISTAASGNMLFASVVVGFLDDDDPNTQLELCLKFLRGKLAPGEPNPLDPLAALYQGMLCSISSTLLPFTLLILYLYILHDPSFPLAAQTSANFLHIDQSMFYSCLQKLRSVLKVPPHSNAGNHGLEFSHTTFADYVKVAIQTGSFGLREADAIRDMRTTCIQWHNLLKEHKNEEDLKGVIRWDGQGIMDHILLFARRLLFHLWARDDLFLQGDLVRVQKELRHFTFIDLPRMAMCQDVNSTIVMRQLAANLIDYQNQNTISAEDCIVRTMPVCPTDHKLLEKYRSLISQWGATVQAFDPAVMDHNFVLSPFIFLSLNDPFDDLDAAQYMSESIVQGHPWLAYILLGYGQNTVLGIFSLDEVEQGPYWQGALERIKTAYTIANTPDNLLPSSFDHALLQFCSQLSCGTRYPDSNHKEAYMIRMDSLQSTLVSFVADARHGHLLTRLQVVTDKLSVTRDPLEIVPLLLEYTLHNIPRDVQMAAHRILAFLLPLPKFQVVHSGDLGQVLHLDHATINKAIQWIHLFVFSWSPPSDPNTTYLTMQLPIHDLQQDRIDLETLWKQLGYHPYFRLEEQVWQEVFDVWIQYGSLCPRANHCLLPRSMVNEWLFLEYAAIALCSIHTNNGLTAAAIKLHNLPFSRCEFPGPSGGLVHTPADDFVWGLETLARRLSESVSLIGPIIRNQPICEVDRLLLGQWAKMGHDFEFAKFPFTGWVPDWTEFYVLPLHADTIAPPDERIYRIFFIGEGHNTCLIAMQPSYTGVTWDDLDSGRGVSEIWGRSTMLDESDNEECSQRPWSWSITPVGTSD